MLAYSVGWVRQGENQYLAVPREVATGLQRDVLRCSAIHEGGRRSAMASIAHTHLAPSSLSWPARGR